MNDMPDALKPSPLAAPPRREALVLVEQVAALYRNTPLMLAVNVAMAGLLTAALPVATTTKLIWLSLIAAQVLVRFGLWIRYRRTALGSENARAWLIRAMWGSFASGCVWGLAGILFHVPGQLEYQLLVLFVQIGMASSAVYALTAYMPAFYAFLFPGMSPLPFVHALQGGLLHEMLAGMIVVYIVATFFFARNLHRVLLRSLHLRFENLDLMEDLQRQKEAAERANAAKSRFLAAASHDLRQPIHALGLFTDHLREELRNQPKALGIADRIESSVEAMEGLFDALLDISRLDAGVIEKNVFDFPVQRLLTRIETMFTPLAIERGLRFSVVRSRAVVSSDPLLLDRIVGNFVANAIKYTAEGGVVVGCRRRESGVSIQVLDSGPGIPEQYHQEVFLEFFQLENPERDRTKGLGLGLAIVARIARLLNHHPVVLRSVVGKGSMFAINVPYGDARLVVNGHGSAPALADRFPGTWIAVVDDETAILQGMHDLLSGWGCNVVAAAGGASLLATLRERKIRPELIITDYRLRDNENGIDLIRQAQREFGMKIPGILVTGDSAPDRVREAAASGFQLLHKPVAPARLRYLMHLLLDRQAGRRAPV